MRIGIVGSGEEKFSPVAEKEAKKIIKELLSEKGTILVSGHSPMGGIDVWAEQIATELRIPMDLKIPKQMKWDAPYGYKQRNLDIAKESEKLYIIVPDKYPKGYKGKRYEECYHCRNTFHIKSGGCYTGRKALELNKPVVWYVVANE